MDTYALARWDSSIYLFEPLTPDTYTADTTAPTLTRWQIDRTNRALILHFNEPVLLNNATSIIISDSSDITSAGSVFSRLNVITKSTSDANYGERNTPSIHRLGGECDGRQCLPVNLHSILTQLPSTCSWVPRPSTTTPMRQPQRRSHDPRRRCRVRLTAACARPDTTSPRCAQKWMTVCAPLVPPVAQLLPMQACSSYADTNCKECSSCAYGGHISTACGDGNDNSCSECTSCGLMEFESVKCLWGQH